MCGGYYEEELEMKDYYGPSTKFITVAGFHQAVGICMTHLGSEEWRMQEEELMIHFNSIESEEKYSRIVTGMREWESTTPFLAS